MPRPVAARSALAGILIALVSSALASPGDRDARCPRTLLQTAGEEARAAVRCEATLARGARPREPCGFDAFAGEGGRCQSTEFASAGRTLVANLLRHLRAQLRPGDATGRCAAEKLRAAARRTRQGVHCAARAWHTGDGASAACRARAQRRFVGDVASAERRADCPPAQADAAAVGETIDAFAAAASALASGLPAPDPAPSGLTVRLDGSAVRLAWVKPAPASGSDQVRLLRRLEVPPSDAADPLATLLQAGPAETFTHLTSDLLPSTSDRPRTYHYAAFGCAAAGDCEPLGSRASVALTLADALCGGGYVVHWRHASADVCADRLDLGPAASTTYPDWWKRCDASCPGTATARQLNAAGVREATGIGEAFRRLGIPVARVVSSEFCRTVSTAELMAFGPPIEQEPGITYFVHDESNRCAHSSALLASPPAPGTNTAIVGHAGFSCPVLGELAWSEAALYKPDGAGGAEHIANVLWDAWDTLD